MNTEELKLTDYKASNLRAFLSLIIPLLLATGGILLALSVNKLLYWSGQLLLSFFFLQTFILLHECAHLNFFSSRKLNNFFGHIFGLLSMIPFYTWQHMHNLHHRWTGWRDKDPTTEKTVEPSQSPVMRTVANVCWFLFIPIFYIVYKLSNYWNLLKIRRFLNPKKFRQAIFHVVAYSLVYVILGYFLGGFLAVLLGPAFILSLVWKELVILTQHSHIDIPVSNGEAVRPIAYKDQVPYTRSFYVNAFFARHFLFNFNLHEAHHAHPGLPAYWLEKVVLNVPEKPRYLTWFKKAKAMKGEDYIFRTSKHTGKFF